MPIPSPVSYPSGLTSPPNSQASGVPVSLGDLLFNAVDSFGAEWTLESLDGWDGETKSTVKTTPRPRAHGSTATTPFSEERVLSGSGLVSCPTPAGLSDALGRLNAAVSLDQTVLGVNESGLVRHMMVQRQDQVLVTRLNQYEATFSFQLVATDPFKYGDLVSYSTSLPSSSGGRTFPITYPTTFTGNTNSGVITLTNSGNASAPVWLRVDGSIPAGGWSVTHLGQQRSLTFATSLALGSGEYVTVDMDRREVLAQGQSARNGWVTSRGWFDLDPGVNSIAFSAKNYDASALLTVTTMSAWD